MMELFDRSNAPELVVDASSGRIIDLNPAAEAFYNNDRSFLLDKRYQMLVSRDARMAEESPTLVEAGIDTSVLHSSLHRRYNKPPVEVRLYFNDFQINDRDLYLIRVIPKDEVTTQALPRKLVQILSSASAAESGLKEGLDHYRSYVHADRAALYLLEDYGFVPVFESIRGDFSPLQGQIPAFTFDQHEWLNELMTKDVTTVPAVSGWMDASDELRAQLYELDVDSFVASPIRFRGSPIAVLVASNASPHTWSDQEKRATKATAGILTSFVQLHLANLDLTQKTQQIEKMSEMLELTRVSLSELATGHISAILGYTSVLLSSENEGVDDKAQKIYNSASSLQELVDASLCATRDLSEVDHTTRLETMFDDVIQTVKGAASRHNAVVTIDLDESFKQARVSVDLCAAQAALRSLMYYAIRESNNDVVKVEGWVEDDKAFLTFTDHNFEGIPANFTTDARGALLPLKAARALNPQVGLAGSLLERIGGCLKAAPHTEDGKRTGMVFTAILPLAHPLSTVNAAPSGEKPLVLFHEPSAETGFIIAHLMSPDANVDVANSMQEVNHCLRNAAYDAIFITGYEPSVVNKMTGDGHPIIPLIASAEDKDQYDASTVIAGTYNVPDLLNAIP